MTDLANVDYFTDADVAQDPYDYWDYLRNQGPVFREPHYGVVAVTGYQEVQAAFKDVDSFSAVNAIGGPFPPLPFTRKATTSVSRSRRIATSSRSSSTWSSWTRPSTKRRAPYSAGC